MGLPDVVTGDPVPAAAQAGHELVDVHPPGGVQRYAGDVRPVPQHERQQLAQVLAHAAILAAAVPLRRAARG